MSTDSMTDSFSAGAAALAEERIKPKNADFDQFLLVAASALTSVSLCWFFLQFVFAYQGALGFWVIAYLVFVAISFFSCRRIFGRIASQDLMARILVWSGALVVIVPLVLVVVYVVGQGYHSLRASFFLEDQRYVGALSDATEGGGAHAIIGTLEQVGIAALISIPLGILSAVYLNEVKGRFSRPLRTLTDAMSAIPSIVAGLFIYAAWILALGNQQSGFAGSLALSVLFLPTVTRTSEVVLRLVPGGLREASLALGGTEWKTTRNVVLPTSRSGLVTAVILGVARVIGETAPLILTIGGAFVIEANPFSGKQDALPFFVYRLIRFPQESQIARAWTGALVLLIIVLVLFVVARYIGGRGVVSGKARSRKFRLRPTSIPKG